MTSKLKLISGLLIPGILVASSASAHIFQMPETNSISTKKSGGDYAIAGKYLDYTSVLTGISLSHSGKDSVKLLVQEQEDWRGHYSIVPALKEYLAANPSLVSDYSVSVYESDRWQYEHLFGKVIPGTNSYGLVADLSTPAARAKFEKFLRAIAPGVMLNECALDNMLESLAMK